MQCPAKIAWLWAFLSNGPGRSYYRLDACRAARRLFAAEKRNSLRLSLLRKTLPAISNRRVLAPLIAAYHQQIDEPARAHPDYALIKSFPGAGPAMAPRLIAAMESQRERCKRAAGIQQCGGIAPVAASSGKLRRVHWRWSFSMLGQRSRNPAAIFEATSSNPSST